MERGTFYRGDRPIPTAGVLVFEDAFDNNAGGDGDGTGPFAKPWTIQGTLFGGAGSETNAAQPTGSGHTDNWAFFQTNSTNGSGITIDTGVATLASQEYSFSFLTGSKDVQVYTGTMAARLFDWDGIGTLAADGTLIGQFNATNAAASSIVSNSQNFTSSSVIEGNVYVQFSAGVNGATAFAQPLLDNVNVSAVPEPSAILLGSLGALALLRRRRF